MKCLKRSVLLFVCVAAIASGTAEAATATLSWNRNPEPSVIGYRVSIGNLPGVYYQTIDVGNVVTWTVQNLSSTQTYYFAVQAYDVQGRASQYSAEVVKGGQSIFPNGLEQGLEPGSQQSGGASLPNPALFWQHENGSLSMWSMNAAIKLDAAYLSPHTASDPGWRIAGAGDFDRDSSTDLVWQHRERGEVAIWLMDGPRQRMSVAVGTESDSGWLIAAVGDMNGDADPDLIWRHQTTGKFAVWFMAGTSFGSAVPMNPPQVAADISTIVGAADFDLDGHTDLLWQHEDGSLSTWFMEGVAMRGAEQLTPSGIDPTWQAVAVADYDRDGRADIVFRKEDGYLAMWFMDGVKMKSTTLLNPKFENDLQWRIVGPK
jgi:hypothetical protein